MPDTNKFDGSVYIANKAKQLVDSGKYKNYNEAADALNKVLRETNYTPEQHYNDYGKGEGIIPYAVKPDPLPIATPVDEDYVNPPPSAIYGDVDALIGGAYDEATADRVLPDYMRYGDQAASDAIDQHVNIRDGSSYVDPDTNTVAGQLKQLLSADSPYLAESRRGAQEALGERGLLNSSIAAGAGQRAAIQSALPIAQQDADTYTQFGLQEQQARNNMEIIQGEAIVSGEIMRQQAALDQQNQNIQNKFAGLMAEADSKTKGHLMQLEKDLMLFDNQLQTKLNSTLQGEQITAERAAQVREQAGAIMMNYQISVENLMSDPDFLAMGPAAVNNAINELQQLARNSINFIGAASEVDLTAFTDEYLADIYVAN